MAQHISNMEVMIESLRDSINSTTELADDVASIGSDLNALTKEVEEASKRLDRIETTLQTERARSYFKEK
jgi:peptidoglycan hydrolase CwlO-like protein